MRKELRGEECLVLYCSNTNGIDIGKFVGSGGSFGGKMKRGRKVGGCRRHAFVEYMVQQEHHCALDVLDVWTGTRLVWIFSSG